MPLNVTTPIFEGDQVAQRIADMLIMTGFTKSCGDRCVKRVSHFLACTRLAAMHQGDRHFLPVPRRYKEIKRKQ